MTQTSPRSFAEVSEVLIARPTTVNATQTLRKMRGVSQAHLMRADDRHHYVVKFDTPQNRRTLVNELLAGLFLEHLGFQTAGSAVVQLSSEVLPSGKHFGSRFPGDPDKTVVYDFVPDSVVRKVENRSEFAGLLAFDKWVGNEDFRQCVFVRATPQERFRAIWIDNGQAFGGPEWQIVDTPRKGIYLSSAAYESVRGWSDFEPWVEALRNFPETVVEQAIDILPPEWVAGDGIRLRRLKDQLLLRRSKVAEYLERTLEQKPEAFSNWRKEPAFSFGVRQAPHSCRPAAASQVA
jgi:hypothetical protein